MLRMCSGIHQREPGRALHGSPADPCGGGRWIEQLTWGCSYHCAIFVCAAEAIIRELAECYMDCLLTHLVEVVCRRADLDL